jgi:hypothetical protein
VLGKQAGQAVATDPKPSIALVCAAHLEGKDLVAQEKLVLKPYVNGTACGNMPGHGEGMCKWFAKMEANIVATAEREHPEEHGRMLVSYVCTCTVL